MNYLEAVSSGISSIGSQESIEKYKLKSTSQIARSRDALEKKEIIDNMGKKLIILDPLFRQWLIKRYFRKK